MLPLPAGILLGAALLTGCASPDPAPGRLVLPDPATLAESTPSGPDAPVPRASRRMSARYLLPYHGRFAGDPRLTMRVAELLRLMPDAMEQVGARLGLDRGPKPVVRIRFQDGRSNSARDLYGAWTDREDVDGEDGPVITFRTESLVAEEYDLDHLLRHELGHCYQIAAYGREHTLPRWVREGLAEWGTGRGRDEVVRHYLLYSKYWAEDPSVLFVYGLDRRLDVEWERWVRYTESTLAFMMIEERVGEEAVRTFARALGERPEVDRAIGLATGLTKEEFFREARTWAADRIRKDLPDWMEHWNARRPLDQRQYEEAGAALDAFLARHPDSLLRPQALAERAVCRMKSGDLDGAERDLSDSKAADRGTRRLAQTHRWLHAALQARRGKWTEVEWEAGLYLFDYDKVMGEHSFEMYILYRQARDEITTGKHWE